MHPNLFDLSDHGRIKVTGEDRARLLHAMTTNHVEGMKPGDSLYAFFLNAQGRIQTDVHIVCCPEYFLLDTEPETRGALLEHLDKFIIADDVTLEDVSDSTCCLLREGQPRFYGQLEEKAAIWEKLIAEGAIPGTPADYEAFRIQRFIPRYGVDITATTLPQESQMMHAVHSQKGCYLGQEIVERVRSRGHVNKTLMGFRMSQGEVPPRGATVLGDGKETGEVTSATSTAEGVFGLAYVRVPYNKPGGEVTIAGRTAQLFPPAAA